MNIVHCYTTSFFTDNIKMNKEDSLMDPKELEELVKPGQDLGPEAEVWNKMTEDSYKAKFAEWVNKAALMMVDQRIVGTMMIKGDGGPYDVMDASDEALALLQYVGNYDKWKKVVEHGDDHSHESQVNVNRVGKFGKTKGRGRFKSGITEEGRDLYDNALRFFEALRDMPMFDVIEQECKRNWINSSAYKSAKSSGRYSGRSLNSGRDGDEGMVCNDEVGDVDERFVRSFYGGGVEMDEYEGSDLEEENNSNGDYEYDDGDGGDGDGGAVGRDVSVVGV